MTKKIKGASQQGTVVDHQKFGKRGTLKRIERNSEYGYGFSFDSMEKGSQPLNLRFFEAPIDAISYYNLNPNKLKNTRFVAMDGLKKEVVANYIQLTSKELAKNGQSLQSVALGVDNDSARNKFVEEMKQFSAVSNGHKLDIQSAQPAKKFGKDWNDALKAVNAKKREAAKVTPTKNFNLNQARLAR